MVFSCSASLRSLCMPQYFVLVFLKVQNSQKKYKGMFYYYIEKHMQKFRHFEEKKFHPKRSLMLRLAPSHSIIPTLDDSKMGFLGFSVYISLHFYFKLCCRIIFLLQSVVLILIFRNTYVNNTLAKCQFVKKVCHKNILTSVFCKIEMA